jgi:hypothetical protein
MGTELAKLPQQVLHAPTSGTQPLRTHERRTRAAETVLAHIVVYLGPVTANAAMTSCCRALGREPESIEQSDVPQLLASLRPMLGTLLGGASCRLLLRRIERDIRM